LAAADIWTSNSPARGFGLCAGAGPGQFLLSLQAGCRDQGTGQ
jgi:hypothetical protein